MREAIPAGQYDSLWSWVEASRRLALPDHELQSVLYPEDRVMLKEAVGIEAEGHPNFQETSVEIPKAFVAVLPEGRYWISEDGTAAVIAPDNKLIWDVSMQYYLPHARHPVFRKRELPPAEYIDETVALMSYAFDSNYYHWMAEVLPRFHLMNRCGIRIDKYIVNAGVSSSYQRETLAFVGIPEHNILQYKKGMHIKAKRLVVPSMKMYSLLPFIPNSPAPWAVNYLRSELFGSLLTRRIEGTERLYVSRGDANHRRVTNEADIIEVLKHEGFAMITPGEMPVSDQIRMFASADVIVAPHGAALANLMFCKPNARLLELFSPNYVNPLYRYICAQVGVDYYYLIGQGERVPIESGFGDAGYRIEPITVDLKDFLGLLHRVLNG